MYSFVNIDGTNECQLDNSDVMGYRIITDEDTYDFVHPDYTIAGTAGQAESFAGPIVAMAFDSPNGNI